MALMPVAEALARVLAEAEPLPAEPAPLTEALRARAGCRCHGIADPAACGRFRYGRLRRARNGRCEGTSRSQACRRSGSRASVRGNGWCGEAARIFTGGVLPPGSDTIVIQENAERVGDTVVIAASSGKGKHVRAKGLDFQRGAALLAKGRRLSDRDLALAAAMNHPTVPVHRRPKVAVLATGDELVMPGATPGFGEIVYSNGYATMALARREGCEVADLGIVPDRLPETVAAVRRARDVGADILVTSGGASVGDYDLVQEALAAEGLALSFWKVALRPGRPMMHGRLGAMHVLGLPGNPVSSYVCAVLFLVPLLRRLAGRADVTTAIDVARLGCDLPSNDERADYLRATLAPGPDGVPVATPAPVQDSSMLTKLARADCLLIREPHAPAAKAGEPCSIITLAS